MGSFVIFKRICNRVKYSNIYYNANKIKELVIGGRGEVMMPENIHCMVCGKVVNPSTHTSYQVCEIHRRTN